MKPKWRKLALKDPKESSKLSMRRKRATDNNPMTTTKHNEECCKECFVPEKDGDYILPSGHSVVTAYPEGCKDEECECHSATDVSWEVEFDVIGFGNQAKIHGFKRYELKSFIAQQIEKAREETVKQTEEACKQYIHDNSFEAGKAEMLRSVREWAQNQPQYIYLPEFLSYLEALSKKHETE